MEDTQPEASGQRANDAALAAAPTATAGAASDVVLSDASVVTIAQPPPPQSSQARAAADAQGRGDILPPRAHLSRPPLKYRWSSGAP